MNTFVYGIGTDILKFSNIENSVNDYNDSFVLGIYTENEINLIKSRPNPLFSFATRFAGKEAVFKSLNVFGNDVKLKEIEILEDENNCPIVHLHGNAAEIANKKHISNILISLSYDTDYAIAFATAIANNTI